MFIKKEANEHIKMNKTLTSIIVAATLALSAACGQTDMSSLSTKLVNKTSPNFTNKHPTPTQKQQIKLPVYLDQCGHDSEAGDVVYQDDNGTKFREIREPNGSISYKTICPKTNPKRYSFTQFWEKHKEAGVIVSSERLSPKKELKPKTKPKLAKEGVVYYFIKHDVPKEKQIPEALVRIVDQTTFKATYKYFTKKQVEKECGGPSEWLDGSIRYCSEALSGIPGGTAQALVPILDPDKHTYETLLNVPKGTVAKQTPGEESIGCIDRMKHHPKSNYTECTNRPTMGKIAQKFLELRKQKR